MKAKKFVTSLVLICISIFTFFGCANVEYYRAVDGTGKIIDKFVVTLDYKKINENKLNYNYIVDTVKQDLTKFVKYVEDWQESAFVKYPDIQLAVMDGIKARYDEDSDNGKYSVSLIFSDWTMFGLFYGHTTIQNGEYEHVMNDVGPFIEEIINENESKEDINLFLYKYSKLESDGIYNEIKNVEVGDLGNYYNKYTTLTGLDLDDIQISQSFAYPDDRIYSNADVIEHTGGMTWLNWDLNNKDEGFKMIIYKIAPKGVAWYILALIISAIFIVILIVVIAIKSRGKAYEKITRREVESREG